MFARGVQTLASLQAAHDARDRLAEVADLRHPGCLASAATEERLHLGGRFVRDAFHDPVDPSVQSVLTLSGTADD